MTDKTKANESAKKIWFIVAIADLCLMVALTILFFTSTIPNLTLDFSSQYFKYIIMEICFIYLGAIVCILLIRKWMLRGHFSLSLLIWAIVSQILSLCFTVTRRTLDLVVVEEILTQGSYIYGIIFNYRITMIFGMLAGLFVYEFYLSVFRSETDKLVFRNFLRIYTIIVSIFLLTPTTGVTDLMQMIVGGLAYIQMFLSAIPIIKDSFKLINIFRQRKSDVSNNEKSVYYGLVFIMAVAIAFLGVGVSYVASLVYDSVMQTKFGPFYLLQNVFTASVLIFSYLGFVMPKWLKKILK